jgi:hypothetical protein
MRRVAVGRRFEVRLWRERSSRLEVGEGRLLFLVERLKR